MTKTKWNKIVIESDGTLTDITQFVKSVEFKPYKPSLWKRLYIWLSHAWFVFKANRSWKKLQKGATISLEVVIRPREPWRWN
jgi:hypothetical protein